MKILSGAILLAGASLLVSCRQMPKMDSDILASHILAQQAIYLDDKTPKYAKLVSRSFGISPREFLALQKHIVQKRKRTLLEVDARAAMKRYIKELGGKRDQGSMREYITQLLVPFMQKKACGEGVQSDIDEAVVQMFGQFFPEARDALGELVMSIERYYAGGSHNADYLKAVNDALKRRGFFMLLDLGNAANVLTIADSIVEPLPYSDGQWLSVLALRREVPGFLPSVNGYSTLGSEEVVVLLDMVEFQAEEVLAELEEGGAFEKFADPRHEQARRRLGIPIGTDEANELYRALLRKDFGNRPKAYVTRALSMEVALHEAKHRVDNIVMPEMTLNYDLETSAYLTAAMFAAAPHYGLLSAILHLEGYCYRYGDKPLVKALRSLWKLAQQDAAGELSEAELRDGLYQTYLAYVTIREGYYLPDLEKFEDEIASRCWKYFARE